MEEIKIFLKTQLGLKNDIICDQIMEASYLQSIKKGDYLVKQGEKMRGLCFLVKGLLRGFFTDYQGNEVTDCFAFRFGAIAMPNSDFNNPSPIHIVAHEDSELFVIPIQMVQQLLEERIEIAHIYSQMLLMGAAEHREIKRVLYEYTAAQRYEWFLQRYEGLIHRVPHIYIASFLGITPVSLSRLRSRLKNKEADMDNRSAVWAEE